MVDQSKVEVKGADKSAMDFANLKTQVMDRIGEIPGFSREMAGKLDKNVRGNPWLHVGIVGACCLGMGFLAGRFLNRRSINLEGLTEDYGD